MPAVALAVVLSACQASTRGPVSVASIEPDEACDTLFRAVDRRVSEHRGGRSFPHRVTGFPYLRSTRVLASFRNEIDSDARADAWLGHLSAGDRLARGSELSRLPAGARRQLRQFADETASQIGLSAGADTEATLNKCRDVLVARDRDDPNRTEQLHEAVVPDDEYSLIQRLGGLYPLTSIGVRAGVARWHDEVRRTYAAVNDAAPMGAERRRYAPEASLENRASVPILRDALDIPQPDEAQLEALYRRHAPVWEVETAGAADIPGEPVWTRGGHAPGVNAGETRVYRYRSITRFRGRPRLQLNYLVWFDARPANGPLDMLAGRLDGIIWRVTLDENGAALVYDSVHACGCYHLLFPVAGVELRPAALQLPEPPLVPLMLDAPPPGTRVHLRLSAGAHYLNRVTHVVPGPASAYYRFAGREALYRTPVVGGGHRSLFREDGRVQGTGRGERWFLWPTGVRSPGAMRERGRRATAFIGRRHFDDPFLFDELLR